MNTPNTHTVAAWFDLRSKATRYARDKRNAGWNVDPIAATTYAQRTDRNGNTYTTRDGFIVRASK